MKKTLLLLFVTLFTLQNAIAQVATGYNAVRTTATYVTLSSPTVLGSGNVQNTVYTVTLPFSFPFNGSNYTTAYVSENGFITFGTSAPSGTNYTPISTTAAGTNGVIAAFAFNSTVSVAAKSIRWKNNGGTSASFEWVKHGTGSNLLGTHMDAQITLYPSGTIELTYRGPFSYPVNGTLNGQVGLRGTTTADFRNLTTLTAAPGYGGANTATASFGTGNYSSVDNTKITFTPSTPMVYSSNTVTQFTGNVAQGSPDNPVHRIQVTTTGNSSPLSVTEIIATTAGTTNTADIAEARLFYTGSNATFSIFNVIGQLGNPIVNPNGTMTFTGTQQLLSGANYFWLVYSVSPTATNGNLLDAVTSTITVNSTNYAGNPTDPAGTLVIQNPSPVCVGTYTTGCNDGIGAIDGFTNMGLNGFSNNSGCSPGAFGDYTGLTPINVYKGVSNLLQVTNPDAASDIYSFGMYIDINGNNVFEDNELILSVPTASTWTFGTLYGSFFIPNIAAPGVRRMRIRCAYNVPVAAGYPCNQYGFGETEDYLVNILENPGVAQVNCGYTATNTTQAYSSITGLSGTTVVASGTAIDDNNYTNQSIGFDFDYNGTVYNSFGINSNGFIWFGTGTPAAASYLPVGSASPNLGGTGVIDGIIAAYGGDLYAHDYASAAPNVPRISVRTTGTPGSRTCTIQWEAFKPYAAFGSFCEYLYFDDHKLSFQIILTEGTSTIRFTYADQTAWCIDTPYNVQVGLRGTNFGDYNLRAKAPGAAASAATAGTSFNALFQWNASNWFTGNTSYLFTPAVITPTVTVGGPTEFCEGGSVNISTPTPSVGYQWFESNILEFAQTNNNINVTESGDYTVRVGNAGCYRSSDPVTVTVSPSPDLSVTNPAAVCLPATVDITNPALLTDANNTVGTVTYHATMQDAIDGNPLANPSAIAVGGTYYIKKSTTVGVCSDIVAVTVTINTCTIEWVGGTPGDPTDWNVGTNWNIGTVPTAADDIVIPVRPNMPRIFAGDPDGTCKNIDVVGQAVTITIDAGKNLEIKGNWSGSSNVIAGNGHIVFSGTTPQQIAGGMFPNFIRIKNPAGVTVLPGVNLVEVFKGLLLEQGVLTTNSSVFTKSSSTQTAYIDDFTTGYTGSISGPVNVERFVPGGAFGFRYIGNPVNTTPGSFNISNLFGFQPSGTPGQVVPLPTCNPNNTANGSPNGNLMRWEEAGPFTVPNCNQSGWYFFLNGSLTSGRGYGIRAFSSTVLRFTGNANSGSVSYGPLSYTNSTGNGWQLVANPFPSPIQISNVDANPNNNMPLGFQGQVQFYQPAGFYTGTYQAYNVSVSGQTPPAMAIAQGFWIRTVSANAFWTLSKDHRVAGSPGIFDVTQNVMHHLKVEVEGNTYRDRTDIHFIPGSTNEFDDYDANKWESSAGVPTLYTTLGNEMVAINSMPALNEVVTVPMAFKPGANGNFTFTFDDIATFPQSAMIYLEDLQLGTMNDLRASNTYQFASTTADDVNRFILHFQPGIKPVVADQDCDVMGSIELVQPAPTVWASYEVKGTDNNVYAQGTNLSGTITINNLPAQEYVVTLTHSSGYVAQEYVTVNGVSTVNATLNASATNVMVNENVTLTANATNVSEYVWNFGDGNIVLGNATETHAYDVAGIYTVVLTASNNECNDVAVKTINVSNTTTGLNNNTANNLTIYGQGERLVVEFNNWGGEKADIFMYNALGQRVESLTGISTIKGRQEMNVAGIKPGYYFIQVVSNGKVQGKKVYLGNN